MTTSPEVIGGADTHTDTLHVAVITTLGQHLDDHEFPTTAVGYTAAIAFLTSHGTLRRVGIEGTSSYGAGLAAACLTAGIEVVEVNSPSRGDRRRKGKSDPLDAFHAAHAVLSGRATAAPKDPSIEAIRSLHVARRSAVKARTATMQQIHTALVRAPEPVRGKYRELTDSKLVTALARCRPAAAGDPVIRSVLTALRALAERHLFLGNQIKDLDANIDELVTAANPGLRASHGVGSDTAAQLLITAGGNPERLTSEASFAARCGVAPVPASSGRTVRHRLSRGGDRHANNALYRIAVVRMSNHPPTHAYVVRQVAAGRSKPEIIRMLKRAIAREIHRHLTQATPVPAYDDLRPARQAKNITLTAAANHFGVWPIVISRIERGLQRHDQLADQYRDWLAVA
ncbi:IS110 family transposase [Nakamurella aerolata]|uniref:IS110 family transposase n=1 Tax=Nakamurella aerolata TaxID=1656892 RepID=A0A849ABZ6_9ACTN|nr:IS110 family transposase [Nakamurella aerolata]NNG37116.1 IS110 family transposase [Nakamurella aerolata]